MMLKSLYDVAGRVKNICIRKPWPLHRDEDMTPFFIVGAGRSGTTLLRRILVASKQVHIPPETYVLAQVIEHYKRNAYQDWQDLVRDCMALFEMHPEFDTFQISLRPLLPRLRALPEHERSLAKMLDMFYRYHAEQTGMPSERWGDKTPINTFALDAIVSVFPKAQFIHLLRDGVDVVASCVQRGLYSDIKAAANRWLRAVQAVQDFSGRYGDQCYQLRYESLAEQPEHEVRALCDWLKLSFSSEMLEQRSHVARLGDMNYAHYASSTQALSAKFVGRGRNQLSAEEKRWLQGYIGSLLQAQGYRRADEEEHDKTDI